MDIQQKKKKKLKILIISSVVFSILLGMVTGIKNPILFVATVAMLVAELHYILCFCWGLPMWTKFGVIEDIPKHKPYRILFIGLSLSFCLFYLKVTTRTFGVEVVP